MAKTYLIIDRRYLVGATSGTRVHLGTVNPGVNPWTHFMHLSQKYTYEQDLGDFFRGSCARYYQLVPTTFPVEIVDGKTLAHLEYMNWSPMNNSAQLPDAPEILERMNADQYYVGFTAGSVEPHNIAYDGYENFQAAWDSVNDFRGDAVGVNLRNYLGTPTNLGRSDVSVNQSEWSIYSAGPNRFLHVVLNKYDTGWELGSTRMGIPPSNPYYSLNDNNMQNWANYINSRDNPNIPEGYETDPSSFQNVDLDWKGVLGHPNAPILPTSTSEELQYSRNWLRNFYDHVHQYVAATTTPPQDNAGDLEAKMADISVSYERYDGAYEAFIEDLNETHLPNAYIILSHIYSNPNELNEPGPFEYLNWNSNTVSVYAYLSSLGTGSAAGDYPSTTGGRFSLPPSLMNIDYTQYPNVGESQLQRWSWSDEAVELPGGIYFYKNYFQKFISTDVSAIPPNVLNLIDLRMKHVGYGEELMRVFGAMYDAVAIQHNLNRFPFHIRVHFEARNGTESTTSPVWRSRGAHFANRMNQLNSDNPLTETYPNPAYDSANDDPEDAIIREYGGSIYDWLLANIIRLNIDPDSRVNYADEKGFAGGLKTFEAQQLLTENESGLVWDSDLLCADMTEMIIASRNLMEPFEGDPLVTEILNPLNGQNAIVGVHDRQGIIIGAPVGPGVSPTQKSYGAFNLSQAPGFPRILKEEKFQEFIVKFKEFIFDVRRSWDAALAGQKAYSETVAFKVVKYKTDDLGEIVGEAVQSFYLPNLPDFHSETGTLFSDIEFIDTQVKYGQKYKYIVTCYNIVVGNQYRYDNIERWPESFPLFPWPDRLPVWLGWPDGRNYPNEEPTQTMSNPAQGPGRTTAPGEAAKWLGGHPKDFAYLPAPTAPTGPDPIHLKPRLATVALRGSEDEDTEGRLPSGRGQQPTGHDDSSPQFAHVETALATKPAPEVPEALCPSSLAYPIIDNSFWDLNEDNSFGTPGFGFYLDLRESLHTTGASPTTSWSLGPVKSIPITINPAAVIFQDPEGPSWAQGRIRADVLAETIEAQLNSASGLQEEYRVRFVRTTLPTESSTDLVPAHGVGRFVIGTVNGLLSAALLGLGYDFWDLTTYQSENTFDNSALHLLSATGIHGSNPETIYESDQNGTAEFDVYDFPSVLLIEEPYCEFDPVVVHDYPPLYPEVTLVPFRGVNNKIRILFNQTDGSDSMNPDSLIIDQTDIENYNNQRATQQRAIAADGNPGEPIVFKSDDHGVSFQVFRTTERPTTYEDFSGHLLTTVLTPGSTSGAYDDTILPNVQYYYTFRTVDGHQNLSIPTAVYRVQLADDNGRIYPIIETITMAAAETRSLTTGARKYLQIGPSLAQAIVNTGSFDLPGEPVQPPEHVQLGVVDDSIWADNKVFKIRLTSKHTGKKLDLNINFDEDPKVNPNE